MTYVSPYDVIQERTISITAVDRSRGTVGSSFQLGVSFLPNVDVTLLT